MMMDWLFAAPFLFAAPVGFLIGHLIWRRACRAQPR